VRGIAEGDRVRLRSVVGQVSVPVRLTEDIAPGVVALPHGFSNENAGDVFAPPNKRCGVNANLLAPGQFIDVPSGTSALNGIAVECE
ncbi:hypothetical protein OEK97_28210, partial [Escherichia coli]|uniref:molybdopterin dinucleotide binding domain-containing protein n=1 Tax=Escherichia coli TaxID=562 RepID=UPI0021D8B9DA